MTIPRKNKPLKKDITPLDQFIQGIDFYRLLADSITYVIWVLDAEKLHISYVAPSVECLLGYLPEEIIGQPLVSFLPEESQEHVMRVIEEERAKLQLQTATPRTLELQLIHKNGGIVWTEVPSHFIRDKKKTSLSVLSV
jgi:PAS domain S-box-containing protein